MSDENSVLDGSSAFPFGDVSKSSVPSGDELARRVGIYPAKDRNTGNPNGRPKAGKRELSFEQRLEVQAQRDNPQETGIIFSEDNDAVWEEGSIVRICLPNGTEMSFALLGDVQTAPWEVEGESDVSESDSES